VIRLQRTPEGHLALPPLPWVNVVANDDFGFLVSETGAGCTWYGNSRENRLTPWSNDPVRDPHGDAFYLRDDETRAAWSCLPGPLPGAGAYEVRHGFGFTRFRHKSDGLALDTTMFATRSDPVRITRIAVTNHDKRRRRVSLYGCAQLVLGGEFRQSGRFVTTWQDDQTGALLARNPISASCPRGVAFAAVVADPAVVRIHHSCSLAGFLGPERDFSRPAALNHEVLDDRAAPETESCFAHQALLELEPGQTATVSFLLGQEADADWAREVVIRYRSSAAVEAAWRQAITFWREGLSSLRIETPSPALDLMVNGWLPYQTLGCRIRGRTAFYQSGGAFGFRDQLQDSSSLLPLWPEKTRRQILLHAAHQFVEGDVLHWWHPPLSQGIRTRFADDLLWLPLLTAEYVATTGDEQILSEVTPYLTAQDLEPGQDEVFLRPEPSGEAADLYDHCCRAIDRSLAVGEHGLPLFGAGDWNDGMNRVGREGRGESVWMGFFLVMVLDGFGPLCAQRGDQERVARYAEHRRRLELALNEGGWDGGWYRRGYYDDGAPLGSHQNSECRIDALAQAWAVLSGVAPPERAAQALAALEENLVLEDPGLIKLLTPPFADTPHDPGYIKGYVAGVRENGGQYTHAALWVVRAMAKARRRDKAAHFLDLLNPILHATTPEQVAVYQTEPYVVAADVYGAAPHVGRGGWTWYTGSSGWMHRAAVESVLGLQMAGGETLVLEPCIPDAWPGYALTWRLPGDKTTYRITVTNPEGCSAAVRRATLDGAPVSCEPHAVRIPLCRDGQTHQLDVILGAPNPAGTTS
jgi:cyclic beta-1,2-glucan synthetase